MRFLDKDDLEPKAVAELKLPDASGSIQDRYNYERAVDAWREQRRADIERVIRPELVSPPRIRALLASSLACIRETSPDTFRAIIALCGGFSDYQCSRWTQEYAEFAFFLQQSDFVRNSAINDAPEAFLPRWGSDDVIYSMAVYLDSNQGGRSDFVKQPPKFLVQSIAYDPTPEIFRVIEALIDLPRTEQGKLTDLLRRLATESPDREVAAEAWVALLASGRTPKLPENASVLERIRWHCGRTVDALRDPVVRFAAQLSETKEKDDKFDLTEAPEPSPTEDDLWSLLNRWLPTLPEAQAIGVFRVVMQALVEATGEPVKPKLTWQGESTSSMNLVLWGEAWASSLAGRGSDCVYDLAVVLDTLKFESEPVHVFLQLEAIVKAANFRFISGSHDDLVMAEYQASNEEAVNYFCTVLHFLCEVAGTFHADFRTGLFNEATSRLLKHPGHPPIMVMLLADYLGAVRQDEFLTVPDEFKRIREVFSYVESGDFSVSDEWKIADLLSRAPAESAPKLCSDLDLAILLCRSDDLSKSDGWKAFTIFLACNVIRQTTKVIAHQGDLWLRLKANVEAQSDELAETLIASLTRAGNGGLTMTETAGETIEAIASLDLKAGRDALGCVLPMISRPVPSEVGRLRRWVNKNWQEELPSEAGTLLSQHAALLMAEHGAVFEPAWIRPILELAHHGDDRSKARAILVLGSDHSSPARDPPTVSVGDGI